MKCEILTFQFAHNYGAVLQCYALKKKIESYGAEVYVSDFIPQKLIGAYGLEPTIKITKIKMSLNEILRCIRRRKQYVLFQNFINLDLIGEKCDNPDMVIIGSDQIWNEEITGKITDYYGTGYRNVKKVSYAGSFGNKTLSEFQKKCVVDYLADFNRVSLREFYNVEQVENLTRRDVSCVLDPVFLLQSNDWKKFERIPNSLNRRKRYILYYALRHDEQLVASVEQVAEELKCPVISIHPTCIKWKTGFMQLNDVGPREFVYLVRHAEVVGTNSFHAAAFSEIFEKKMLYKAFSNQESRVPTLLCYCGVRYNADKAAIYDFGKCDLTMMSGMLGKSEEYLKDIVQK